MAYVCDTIAVKIECNVPAVVAIGSFFIFSFFIHKVKAVVDVVIWVNNNSSF
jgi:hypothetical protein